MPPRFDHEKLNVYQRSLAFVAWSAETTENISGKHPVCSQLDRAATSIPLNIAEGNGRHTAADRCRFFDIARGSALECAAALDVLIAKKLLPETEVESGKQVLAEIVTMLVGLIRSNSESRMCEDGVSYRSMAG